MSQRDEDETQALPLPAPSALQSQENPCRELCALMDQLGRTHPYNFVNNS